MLSDIELYYSQLPVKNNLIKLSGEECHHIKDVMRHKTGDELFVTNGLGGIFKTVISDISKEEITASVLKEQKYPNKFENITFCIPRLKSADRFEFALEKCVELGVTKFIVFESERTIAKGEKIERWNKILLSAMKQSLRAWLPKINYVKNYKELFNLNGYKLIFEQTAELSIQEFLTTTNKPLTKGMSLFFGPEGGLTSKELDWQMVEGKEKDVIKVKLTDNRLRSETAIVTAASILTFNLI